MDKLITFEIDQDKQDYIAGEQARTDILNKPAVTLIELVAIVKAQDKMIKRLL